MLVQEKYQLGLVKPLCVGLELIVGTYIFLFRKNNMGLHALEEDYREDENEGEKDEKDGGEYVVYEEKSVKLPMSSILTLRLLFIDAFYLKYYRFLPNEDSLQSYW